MPTKNNYSLITLVALVLLLGGCAVNTGSLPKKKPVPNVGYQTAIHEQLTSLPKPAGKIPTAVYAFDDKTGQYRSSQQNTFSTAVTQGGASILTEALKDSGWFTPLERGGLQHLLKERKLIQRANGRQASTRPLKYANILLEGGIIGYEKNTVTGGIGAKYFGIGGDVEMRHDQVTVYLRAVSTETGEILKSVSVTKSILSHKTQFSFLRYIRPKRLMEAEAGYAQNTPRMIAVMEAIEKAVFDLTVTGIQEGLWKLKNPQKLNEIQKYTESAHVDSVLVFEDGKIVRKKKKNSQPELPKSEAHSKIQKDQ